MNNRFVLGLLAVSLSACANELPPDPLEGYEELEATTILDAPSVDLKDVAPANRDAVRRGEYMVELLGCGTCHTNGALVGEPDTAKALAGSDVGIAYTTPQQNPNPGIVFAPNLTSDIATGIGGWADEQLAVAIRQGRGRHSAKPGLVMPWPGYSKLSDDDTAAIVQYLRNLKPVKHRVPRNVEPGEPSSEAFVYFGFFRKD